MTETITPEQSLFTLASEIRAAHADATSALSTSLHHARRAGDRLRAARERCESEGKKWRKWLADYAELPERTARVYMRVSKHWARVEKASSLREAIEMLREPKGGNAVAASAKLEKVTLTLADREFVDSLKPFFNTRTTAETLAAIVMETRERWLNIWAEAA
jgi:hypothetical protein